MREWFDIRCNLPPGNAFALPAVNGLQHVYLPKIALIFGPRGPVRVHFFSKRLSFRRFAANLLSRNRYFAYHPAKRMKYTILVFFVTCYIGMAPVSASTLLNAARAGNDRQVGRMLGSGVDIRERGPRGETALHWMAFYGNQAMVRRLIEAGAGIDDRLDKGSTPLHLAAYNGHTGVVRLLIDKGARVNVRTRTGFTPLDWARRNGHAGVAELLLAHRAKPGKTPAGGDNASRRGGYGQEISGSRGAAAPMERARQDTGEKGAYSPLAQHRPSAGQSPAGGARAGSRKLSLKDLRYEPDQDWAPKQRPDPQPADDTPASDGSNNKQRQPNNPPQTASYRIQLAAVSSKQRATRAWQRYRRQHGDILADLEPMIDRISLRGKALYRVQMGWLTRRDAQSICDQLKRRSQPCMVVNTGSP